VGRQQVSRCSAHFALFPHSSLVFCGLAWGVWEWDGSKEPGTFCRLGLVHLRATRDDDKIPLERD